MRRRVPFVICFFLCALASGMTLMALAQDVRRPSISGYDRSAEIAAANIDLVRRFYADVAVVLATGDAALLDATVAPDLTEHPTRLGAASGRDGFVRTLLALRATFPHLKIVVDDVRAAGDDQVLARVHAEGAGSGDFLGRSAPASIGRWGPLEVWRIADGQLVERWGGIESTTLLPLGQTQFSVDTLGPGRRRLTVTHMSVEPGAMLPVDNGQALRMFAVDAGTLTVEVADRPGGMVTVARGSAKPSISRPGTSITTATGDRVVTAPEANYTLSNAGSTPAVVVVVIISNIVGGEWPLNSSAAAAAWTVAEMPEALGGVLPSPNGFSARLLAADVEVEMAAQPILTLGWMFLAPGATLELPAGDTALLAGVDEGWVESTVAGGSPNATLAAGEWTVVPAGAGSRWQSREVAPSAVLLLTVGQDETTR